MTAHSADHGRSDLQQPSNSVIHTFKGNEARDDAMVVQGDLGIIPPHNAKGHTFVQNTAYGTSLMLSGSMNMVEVAQMMRDRLAAKREATADKRAAAALNRVVKPASKRVIRKVSSGKKKGGSLGDERTD